MRDSLRVWREATLRGLSRATLVVCILATTWVVPELLRQHASGSWVILSADIAMGCIVALPLRLRLEVRARIFILVLSAFLVFFVPVVGVPGGLGVLITLMAVAGILLLGVREAMVALVATLAFLLLWLLRLGLGWIARPSVVASDIGSFPVAARVVLSVCALSFATFLAVAYVFQKLMTTLVDAERSHQQVVATNERYVRYETALAALTRIRVPRADALPGALAQITELVSTTLDADRTSIWTFKDGGQSLHCEDMFEQPAGTHSAGMTLSGGRFPALFGESIAEPDVIAWEDLRADERLDEFLRDYVRPAGIGGFLRTQIRSQAVRLGVLACAQIGAPRRWTADEKSFALTVANIIAALMAQVEQQRLQEHLVHAQKIEAVGLLADGVAHDVNNSLTIALASAELILVNKQAGEEPREFAAAIRDACVGAAGLTRQLLAIGRKDVANPEVIAPRTAIERLAPLLRAALGKRTIAISISAPADSPNVRVNIAQLRQVLLNLAINARDAMPGGGELHIDVESGPTAPAYAYASSNVAPSHPVRIHVRDTGEGIAGDVLPRIFEAFFTTKGVGKGTGLGLSLARAFAEASGGRIAVRSRVGQGTTVTIELPGVRAVDESVAKAGATDGAKRILVVDDDTRVRDLIVGILKNAGHTVLAADSGEAAMPLITDAKVPLDLLCTDAAMPGMGGESLVRCFREARPGTPILVCSAYVNDATLRAWIESAHVPVLHKPFSPAELVTRVRGAIEQPPRILS